LSSRWFPHISDRQKTVSARYLEQIPDTIRRLKTGLRWLSIALGHIRAKS
jgi:hypothetical protein